LRRDKLEAHLAVIHEAPAQVPQAAARRLSELPEVRAKALGQVRLVADRAVELSHVVPTGGCQPGKRVAPLLPDSTVPDHELCPGGFVQQQAQAGVPYRATILRRGDDAKVLRA